MKMTRFLLVALAAAMAAASCRKAEPNPAPAPVPGGGNGIPVRVALSTVVPHAAASAFGRPKDGAKAAPLLPEGKADAAVHDLWAVQYDENGQLVGVPYYTAEIPAALAGSAGVDSTYDGLTVQLTGSGGKSHTVYFVANTGSPTLFGVDLDVSTEARLNAAAQRLAAGSELQFDAARGIPMLGVYSGPVSSSAGMAVQMKRLAARIVLRYKSSLSGFTVTGVQLKNVASGLYYCPEPVSGSDFPARNTVPGSESHLDYPAEDLSLATAEGDYKKLTWYVPENLRRAAGPVLAAGDRTLDKTDGKATYIEITGVLRDGDRCRKGTLRVLLGDAGTDPADFDVRRNTVYTVTADIGGLNEGDNRLTVESFDMSNCAMLRPGGADSVTFDIRKLTHGWQTTMPALGPGAALRAQVLWADDADLARELSVRLDKVNGLLTVRAPGAAEGNAVVALYDDATAGGNILWSWHAWVTPYRPGLLADGVTPLEAQTRPANTAFAVTGGQVHTYGAEFQRTNGASRVIMDRNLGATKAYYTAPAAGDATAEEAFGLLYQWGRKDPFPRALGGSIDADAATGSAVPIYGPNGAALDAPGSGTGATGFRRAVIGDVIGGKANTLAVAVQNPLLFIYNPDLYRSCDWYAEVRGNQNDALWGDGALKSPYDPCPKGWRVGPAGTWDDFTWDTAAPAAGTFPFYVNGSVLGADTKAYVTNGRLYTAEGAAAPLAWYPATGFWARMDGELTSVGVDGYSWSSTPTPNTVNAVQLFFNMESLLRNNGRRAHGASVRCVQYVE